MIIKGWAAVRGVVHEREAFDSDSENWGVEGDRDRDRDTLDKAIDSMTQIERGRT